MNVHTRTAIQAAIRERWIGPHEAAMAAEIINANGLAVFWRFCFKREECTVLRRIKEQCGKPLHDPSALQWPS